MNYRHTQIAYIIIAVLASAILLLTVLIAHTSGPRPVATLVIMVIFLLVFSSLTIEIRDNFLTWKFGIGLIRKGVPISDIIRATQVTTRLQRGGWGIHRTRSGWLYNVSGFQAVEFELKNGKKFRLGTDDPEALARAVTILVAASGVRR